MSISNNKIDIIKKYNFAHLESALDGSSEIGIDNCVIIIIIIIVIIQDVSALRNKCVYNT